MTEHLPSIVEFSADISKQKQPEPLPAGEYVAVIRAAEQRVSQRDTRYAATSFFVGADQYPVDYQDGNPDGTTLIYRRVSLEDTPQGRFGARRFCEAIGAPMGKRIDLSEWIGMEASVTIVHETYEDVLRAVISSVQAP